MKHKRKLEGLEARRTDYHKMKARMNKSDIPQGFSEPGSIKKSHVKIEKRRSFNGTGTRSIG